MSLYKNMFRFILDDSITGRMPLRESNSLYRAFFEDAPPEEAPETGLEQSPDLPLEAPPTPSAVSPTAPSAPKIPLTPAQKEDLVKLPGKSPLFVRQGTPRNKMNPNLWLGDPLGNPVRFIPVVQDGIKVPRGQRGSGAFDGGSGSPSEDDAVKKHKMENQIIQEIIATFKSSEVFGGPPVGLEDVADIKLITTEAAEPALQIGKMIIKRVAGLKEFENEMNSASPQIDKLRESLFYQNELKKAKANYELDVEGLTEDEMTAKKLEMKQSCERTADREVQSVMAHNKLVDILLGPNFKDKETGEFNATVKTMNTFGTSIEGMTDAINQAFVNLRRRVREAQHVSPDVKDNDADTKFLAVSTALSDYRRERPLQDTDRAKKLQNKIWSSTREALFTLKNKDPEASSDVVWADTLAMKVLPAMAETFADFFTVASGAENGYHIIPKSDTTEGVDSITVYNNSDTARGIRMDMYTIDAEQVKFETGGSATNDARNALTICAPIPVPTLGDEDAHMISGLEARIDSKRAFNISNSIWSIRDIELGDRSLALPRNNRGVTEKVDMNNPDAVASRDAFLERNVDRVASKLQARTTKRLGEIDVLYDKYQAALLYHIGFNEEMVEDLFQNPLNAHKALETIKGHIAVGNMPILNTKTIAQHKIEDDSGHIRIIRDYVGSIQTNNGEVRMDADGKKFREGSINVEHYNEKNDPRFDALSRSMWKLSMLSTYLGCALNGDSVMDYQAFSLIKFGKQTVETADGGQTPKLNPKDVRVTRSTPAIRGHLATAMKTAHKYGSSTKYAYFSKMFNYVPEAMGAVLSITDKKPKSFEKFKKLMKKMYEFFSQFRNYNSVLWG